MPSKAFRIMLGDSWFDLAEKQKRLRSLPELLKITEAWKSSNFFKKINIQIAYVFLIFQSFGVIEVYEVFRLLQTVQFLTDSVFYVLFAYFDESMSSIGGYEP